jgi:hypothetical protein
MDMTEALLQAAKEEIARQRNYEALSAITRILNRAMELVNQPKPVSIPETAEK